jgi:hypothetical protein
MRGLPRRHLPLAVLFRDGEIDALVQGAESQGQGTRAADADLYVGGAAAETILWRDRLVRDLKAGGAQVLHALPRNLTPSLVTQYLEIKAQQLL